MVHKLVFLWGNQWWLIESVRKTPTTIIPWRKALWRQSVVCQPWAFLGNFDANRPKRAILARLSPACFTEHPPRITGRSERPDSEVREKVHRLQRLSEIVKIGDTNELRKFQHNKFDRDTSGISDTKVVITAGEVHTAELLSLEEISKQLHDNAEPHDRPRTTKY